VNYVNHVINAILCLFFTVAAVVPVVIQQKMILWASIKKSRQKVFSPLKIRTYIFTVLEIHVVVFWAVTLCNDVVEY